jgi:hypothetical protein
MLGADSYQLPSPVSSGLLLAPVDYSIQTPEWFVNRFGVLES